MQTRKWSAFEVVVGAFVGFVTSLALQVLVLPHYGLVTNWSSNLEIGAIFTAVSLTRGYLVRRLFAMFG